MRLNTKNLLRSKTFARLVYGSIRLYSATLRLSVINEKPWKTHLENGGKVLICTWHQQFFSLIRHFKTYQPYRPSLMISQSADGDLIAAVANYSGWHTARGSSSRGGRTALSQMIECINKTGLAAHILDGPLGPAGIVKAGVIKMAMDTGARLVPVYTEADKYWTFNSWDRFMIPKPFARVTIRYGEMLPPVPPGEDPEELERHRKNLEELMRPALIA